MGSKEDLISSCRALQAVMAESVEMLERKTVDSSEVVGMETCRVMLDTARERLIEARRQLRIEESPKEALELSFGTPFEIGNIVLSETEPEATEEVKTLPKKGKKG